MNLIPQETRDIIAAVKQHSELYEEQDPRKLSRYVDKWEEVGRLTNMEPKEALKKWKVIKHNWKNRFTRERIPGRMRCSRFVQLDLLLSFLEEHYSPPAPLQLKTEPPSSPPALPNPSHHNNNPNVMPQLPNQVVPGLLNIQPPIVGSNALGNLLGANQPTGAPAFGMPAQPAMDVSPFLNYLTVMIQQQVAMAAPQQFQNPYLPQGWFQMWNNNAMMRQAMPFQGNGMLNFPIFPLPAAPPPTSSSAQRPRPYIIPQRAATAVPPVQPATLPPPLQLGTSSIQEKAVND